MCMQLIVRLTRDAHGALFGLDDELSLVHQELAQPADFQLGACGVCIYAFFSKRPLSICVNIPLDFDRSMVNYG